MLDRRVERELLPMARTYGYGIIPWSRLAGGLLSGKYARGKTPPGDSRFANAADHPMKRERFVSEVFDVVEALEPLAEAKNATVAQVALAWCMHQPGVTSPIIGPRTMEQLDDNLGALGVEINDDDRAKLDEVVPPGTMVSPFYQADFGPHEHLW